MATDRGTGTQHNNAISYSGDLHGYHDPNDQRHGNRGGGLPVGL